jgi:flagellar M-ring protein FliF
MLQKLAASWFAGLVPEQVEVVDTVNVGSMGSDGSLAYAELTEDNPVLQQQFAYEQRKKNEILNLLGPIRGALVEVHAVLSPQVASKTYTKTPDEKGTLQRTEMEEETTNSASMAPGGRPGLAAQGPGAQPDPPSPTEQNDSAVTRDENSYLVGYKEQATEEAGPTVQDVNATVRIPMDWLVETIWTQRWKLQNPDADEGDAPPPTPADLKQLEEEQRTQLQTDIENILPEKSGGQNPFPRVQVSFFHTPEIAPIPEPTLSETAMAWTAAHWTMLAMFGLALASLWMLRSMVKSAGKQREAPAGRPTLQLDLPAGGEGSEEEEAQQPRLRLNKGPTLKDDLAQLVRDDPDTAATILRAWINDAA